MKSFMILMLNMFKSFLSPSLPTRAEGLVYGNSTVFHFANRPETQGTGQSQTGKASIVLLFGYGWNMIKHGCSKRATVAVLNFHTQTG